ncbi:cell wall-binding repeat-containing protein [Bacillus alkalisoli]|uniref:cell wall-binding repeat-containing protein n=1 Tax=Bacillus alkalisoli TaxID=2011008 RepID=UPI000C24CC08|nr:cell wall-binding repeat-containing protein [Bacillus alkalisoli]
MRKYRSRRGFAIILSVLLVFTSMGNFASAQSTSSVNMIQKNVRDISKVIDSEVLSSFKIQEFVEVLVELNEQVEPEKIATMAKAQLSNQSKIKPTPYEQNMAAKHAVVHALKTSAETSQKPLLDSIQQFRDNGQVKDVESFYIMNVIYLKTTIEVVENIAKRPEVAKISPDFTIEIDWPEISVEEINNNVQQAINELTVTQGDSTIEWNINRVEAPRVWNEFGINGNGVVVGMIDTGIHWQHDTLKEKWRGYNPLDPNNPNPTGNWFDAISGQGMPYDIASIPHGTHVMGTILGEGPDGKNKIGVAPGAKWIAAKAFTAQGGQASHLLAAGEFMLAPNGDPNLAPDIVNNSWGGGSARDDWYRPMVNAWRAAGILPVFSAGNSYPNTVGTPGNYPESYAVGATDINNRRGSFSSVGPGPYAGDLKPDIAAPGVNIRSSVPNNGYESWNGTSMASPHVAGVAALLRSVDASLSVDELEEIMNEHAVPLTDTQYPNSPNYGYGRGLVNAYESVASIATGMGGIKGSVLKEGSDNENPVIVEHEEYLYGYRGLDVTLSASVTDNISVVKVELLVREDENNQWETVEMDRVMGDYRDGVYAVAVPLEYVKDPGFEYMINAYDFSGNTASTEIYEVEILFGINPNHTFESDFSTELDGLLLSGDWQWGKPSGTGAPTQRSGEKLVGTNITGNYSDNSNSFLRLPPLDLRDVDNPTLSFKHWFDIEFIQDYGKVLVTNDLNSGEWMELEHFTGRERTWNDLTIDLEPYAGSENPVFVGLLFKSDDRVSHAGWYIDQLKVENVANVTDTVAISNVASNEKIPTDGLTLSQMKWKNINVLIENNPPAGLPLEAIVTVVETGRTVKSSLEDGSFTILHRSTPEGESYTIKVESYGYYSQLLEFTLEDEQIIDKHFLLEEVPRGSISLVAINSVTNQQIEGARVRVVEDGMLPIVYTNSNGYYQFEEVLEGDYTVSLSLPNYHPKNVRVSVSGGETTEIVVEIDPFPGTVISYDDGTAENARSFYSKGYGFAKKMTPDELANLVGASVYLWGADWPTPGGNKFSIAVYESNAQGEPGARVIAPVTVEGIRGQWNYVDLSDFAYQTDKDYFVVFVQTEDFPDSPGIGIDESSPFADRSYQLDNTGKFTKSTASNGNFMIRSHVNYSVESPMLHGDGERSYVNDSTVIISGTGRAEGTVTIYNNGEEVSSIDMAETNFQAELSLTEGKNVITAVQYIGSRASEPSNEVIIVKDITNPVIIINGPENGLVTNKETVLITGFVEEENLAEVTINGEEVVFTLDENVEHFNHSVTLNEGMNSITVRATDLAGNVAETVVAIELDSTPPVISGITPNSDQYIVPGDIVTITVLSDTEGGTATLSLLNESGTTIDQVDMNETTPGQYKLNWTVPVDISSTSVQIKVEVTDLAGNASFATANGKLFILHEKMARINGQDRYLTAVEVSKEGWDKADVIILTRGNEFADALAGVPLAHKLNAPMLLTRSNLLPNGVKEEIVRLGATKVIMLGGTLAINSSIEEELKELNIEMERIFGQDRYETASRIAEKVVGGKVDKAVLVNGRDFPDALSVAPFAAKQNMPILLTRQNVLPEATSKAIRNIDVKELYVIGGQLAVSDEITKLLPKHTRISGSTRYETNVNVMKHFNTTSKHAYVATGRQFADALTGSVLASKNQSGILLVGRNLEPYTINYIIETSLNQLTVFGGELAISQEMYNQLEQLLP